MVGQTLSYAYETPGRPDIYPASFFVTAIIFFELLKTKRSAFTYMTMQPYFNTLLLNP